MLAPSLQAPPLAADVSIPLSPSGTSDTSMDSLSSLGAELQPARGPSRELLVIIKGLMRSNAADRWSLEDLWEFPALQRLLGMVSGEQRSRVSIESAARSSLDDWEELHRQRNAFGTQTASPQPTRIDMSIAQVRYLAKPALVPEALDFVDDIVCCWHRILI